MTGPEAPDRGPLASIGPSRETAPVAPDHLLVWLSGLRADADPPFPVDEELDRPDFTLAEWVGRVLDGYPDAVLCAVHERGHPDWRVPLHEAVAAVTGHHSRYTGDTLPTDLARLRRWVRATLEDHARDTSTSWVSAEDVVLLTDELVVNASEHADRWVTVDLVPRPHGVLVAVGDPRPRDPVELRTVAPAALSGRGLRVVSELSSAWGVLASRSLKTVWAWVDAETS
jgi:anti-sigma regulatory factor (Ser/Thr protein kinase)